MIHNCYSVYDKKAAAYMQPFMSPNHATAIRAVSQVLTDPSHMFSLYCEDYVLIHLGQFDDNSGEYAAPEHGPLALSSLLQLMPKPAEQLPLFTKEA